MKNHHMPVLVAEEPPQERGEHMQASCGEAPGQLGTTDRPAARQLAPAPGYGVTPTCIHLHELFNHWGGFNELITMRRRVVRKHYWKEEMKGYVLNFSFPLDGWNESLSRYQQRPSVAQEAERVDFLNRRLLVRAWRCTWARHLTQTAPDKLARLTPSSVW